jgi:hypothetical protein
MNVMRLTRLTTKFAMSAFSLVLTAAVLAWPAPVRAEEDVPVDTKILRGILESLGLKRDGEAINYQERAPLVIPPGRTLPPPEKAGAAIANNPAWPIDPDVQRRKIEAAQERSKSANADDLIQNEARPLRPNEMTPGPKPRTPRRDTTSSNASSPHGNSGPLSPSELGTKGNIFSNMFGSNEPEAAKFTGEPPRTALTEPPPGYQTPSPDQPYGVGKQKPASNTPSDYLRDHPVGNGN